MPMPQYPILFLFSGLGDPDYDAPQVGFYELRRKINERFPNVIVEIHTWQTPIQAIADRIARGGFDWIGTGGVSLGAGVEATALCKALGRLGITVDLFLAVDIVPGGTGGYIASQFGKYSDVHLPENIRRFASWRTLNWSLFMPWGREILPNESGLPEPVLQISFGSEAAFEKYRPAGALETDTEVLHDTIDNLESLHLEVLAVLQVEFEKWTPLSES